MRHDAVMVFAKPAIPGIAKTRLLPALGVEGTFRLHEALLADAVARLVRLAPLATPYLYLAGDGPSPPAAGVVVRRQRGNDLGDRLIAAFAEVLSAGHGRAVVLGIDSPTMPDGAVPAALAALETADVVIGPCPDGGYYLLALKEARPELFDGMAWSGSEVKAETATRAARLGLEVHELPELFDVDRPEDLPVLAVALRGEASAWAPATRAFVEARA